MLVLANNAAADLLVARKQTLADDDGEDESALIYLTPEESQAGTHLHQEQ